MKAWLALIAVALTAAFPAASASEQSYGESVRCGRDCLDARTAAAGRPRQSLPAPLALVTAETENRLWVVSLPSGQIEHEVRVPSDPEDVATTADNGGLAIVVSSSAGDVSVVSPGTLRVLKTFGGFDEPHIVAASPDGQHAYVTDDSRGTVTAIQLSDMSITSTIYVGVGAHHIAFSPDQRQAWVALGEVASQITILNTSNIDDPHVIGHFTPGFPAHDLAFTPNGRQIWITSSDSDYVTAFDAQDRRMLFRVPAGAPPQHLAFDGVRLHHQRLRQPDREGQRRERQGTRSRQRALWIIRARRGRRLRRHLIAPSRHACHLHTRTQAAQGRCRGACSPRSRDHPPIGEMSNTTSAAPRVSVARGQVDGRRSFLCETDRKPTPSDN